MESFHHNVQTDTQTYKSPVVSPTSSIVTRSVESSALVPSSLSLVASSLHVAPLVVPGILSRPQAGLIEAPFLHMLHLLSVVLSGSVCMG